MERKVLGLIPAKGASTRVPMKNIRSLSGKPLIEYAVNAANASNVIDDLYISTESDEVAAIAERLDAQIIRRPEKLAVNPAGVEQVALHSLDQLTEVYTDLVILLPTSPFRTSQHIKEAWHVYREAHSKRLMSVCEVDDSPYSSWTLSSDGEASPLFPDLVKTQSQRLPKTFRCNGAIHMLDVAEFLEVKSYTAAPLQTYEMPRQASVDIDTEDDWEYAEWLMSRRSR